MLEHTAAHAFVVDARAAARSKDPTAAWKNLSRHSVAPALPATSYTESTEKNYYLLDAPEADRGCWLEGYRDDSREAVIRLPYCRSIKGDE
jgi:hypothetical protein